MACFSCFGRRSSGGAAASSAFSGSARTGKSRSGGGGKHSAVSSASAASQRSIPDLYEKRAHKLRAFDFDELRDATNDFSRMNKIGEGGFGSVYNVNR